MTFHPALKILGHLTPAYQSILTNEASHFLVFLQRSFNPRRLKLLEARQKRQKEIHLGQLPTFLPETEAIRQDPIWMGAKPAPGLIDRRVEITGPVDRKMIINALNCGATQFMADFEGKSSSFFCSFSS